MSSESSLSHRACLVRFTFTLWFAGYYTVKNLHSAHHILITRRTETVTEIVAAADYSGVPKKIYKITKLNVTLRGMYTVTNWYSGDDVSFSSQKFDFWVICIFCWDISEISISNMIDVSFFVFELFIIFI